MLRAPSSGCKLWVYFPNTEQSCNIMEELDINEDFVIKLKYLVYLCCITSEIHSPWNCNVLFEAIIAITVLEN